MLIVLEGPDLAGKSTLATLLRNRIYETTKSLPTILRFGPLKRDPLDEYLGMLNQTKTEHIICDRFHTGEAIYGPLLRGESRMPEHIENYIDMALATRGAILVNLDIPLHTLFDRYKERGDDLVDSTQLARVAGEYVAHRLSRSKIESALPWYLSTGNEGELNNILDTAHQVQHRQAPFLNHPSFVGGSMLDILYVGDRRSTTAERKGLRTAFAPYGWSSGSYLMEALTPICRTWSVGLVNGDDDPNLMELWQLTGKPKLVALGDRASNMIDVPHGKVPHPQWVKRFRSGKMRTYTNMLGMAADGAVISTSDFNTKGL